MKEVTAVINFHKEGLIAHASILSYIKNVNYALDNGVKIYKYAILDSPDEETLSIVDDMRLHFDKIEVVNYKDLGASKNHAVNFAKSEFISFFDGDDLWGKSWLFKAAENIENLDTVLHPELVYYFDERDFNNTSLNDQPRQGCNSFMMIHIDSKYIPKNVLYFNHVYTSNIFTSVKLLKKYPFLIVNKTKSHGVEDWTWNALTVENKIEHKIVSNSVHLVRVKTSNSLGALNSESGLLPPLYEIL